MYYKTKWAWLVFYAVLSLNIVYLAFDQPIIYTSASTMDVKKINATYPKLFVTKSVDKSEVVIGESITVTVTIENFGNKTAFNATFIDQLNSPLILEVYGLTQLSYAQIGVNETRQFSYLVNTKSIGTYYILSAQVEYYDSEINPTKLVTISNNVEITVIEPPEDFSLANFNAAITLLIVLVVLDALLFFRLITPKLNRRPKIS